MIKKLQKRFALSEQGAKDLIKGCLACALQNISLMIPIGLLYMFVCNMLDGSISGKSIIYIIGCVLCLAFTFIATWFQYNGTFLATYVESGVRRISLAEKLRKIPLSFFGKKDLADLSSSIMNDCASLETAFSHFIPELAGSIISTILIAIGLFVIDWRMALSEIWVLPIAFAIVGFSSKIQNYFSKKKMSAAIDLENGVQECIETLKDLRSNNAEFDYLDRLNVKINSLEKRQIASEFGTAAFVVSAGLILKLGIASAALVGSIFLVQGTLSVPVFFMFLLAASRIYEPLDGALQNLAAIISTRTNIDRMNEILDHPVQSGKDSINCSGYDIEFDHVGFAYNNDETILKDVSFCAKQGEVTALVGPSGGGKTTVSRLAARFWDLNKGKITVGGEDISKIDPETLLSLYSIVFQDVTLFNNTIMENIRIGKKNASDEEVLAAAKLANCDEFADKLPDGYNSMIGENGCTLSGGERQRISIARAFLKDSPIILLDEATASLDTENETLIQSALSRLIENKTVMVIAHRMRTVSGADKIVVLSDGIVKEQGTPQELLKKGGTYAHMSKLQEQSSSWTIV